MIQLIIGIVLALILGPLLALWVNKIRGATGPHILPWPSEIEPLQVGKTYRVNPSGSHTVDNGRGQPIRCDVEVTHE